jgi:hypothetical protein
MLNQEFKMTHYRFASVWHNGERTHSTRKLRNTWRKPPAVRSSLSLNWNSQAAIPKAGFPAQCIVQRLPCSTFLATCGATHRAIPHEAIRAKKF